MKIDLLLLFAVITWSEERPLPLRSFVFSMNFGTRKQTDNEPQFALDIQNVKHSVKVSSPLYGNAQLPCSFPFIEGPEELTMAWKIEENKDQLIDIHSFMNGQEHHLEQDSRYKGRTEFSTGFSHGDLGLILREVTFADEGAYYCLAANKWNRDIKKVELSISGLNVLSQDGTLSEIDGKKRLTCVTIGMFRDPWVRWYDLKNTNLTKYETHHMTDLANGTKKVESVLKYDDEPNKYYACQVGEGILSTTVHIARSDGKDSVRLPDSIPGLPGHSSPKEQRY